MGTFTFTEDMAEVTGLGGVDERACRTAVCAGAAWWADHPEADPVVEGDNETDGFIFGGNDEGRALVDAINNAYVAMDDGVKVRLAEYMTPAMYYVVFHHVMYIGRFGWKAYVEQMRLPLMVMAPQSQRPS